MQTAADRTHSFNVLLSPEELSKLQRIADIWQQSKGAALRKMLQSASTMELETQPMCANGQRCYVPQMHPPPAPAIHPVNPNPGTPHPINSAPYGNPDV